MPADNVTPFRRPPPKRPAAPQQSGWGLKTHRGKAVLAHLMTLAAFALALVFTQAPLSFVALGVAVAAFLFVYSNRGAGMPWANTHHEHALRTLVIGYSIMTLADVVVMVTVTALTPEGMREGLFLFAVWTRIIVVAWAGLRALIALVLAVMRKPVPNPRGWLV
ncbi:MAG: hypothetical protein ABL883_07575 [Terricaulis sp.]